MKRWVFLFAVFAAFMIAFAGCSGGDDGSPYGTPDSGAGSDSGVDGNPGYGVVDSGGDHDASKDAGVTDDGSVTDGGEFDAGFDAGPPDAGPPFAITAAASTSDTTVTITYNEPPNATEATTKTSYAISGGLTVSGATIVGNVVTLTTSVQSSTSYMVTVSGVTRASDASALITDTANFTGRNAFDVSSAASGGSTTVSVTFDAPPDMTTATTASNYAISGLTISAAALSGNVVTLTTSTQSATTYSLAVSNVTRASDGEALSTNHATFTGHTTFNVTSASATSATTVDVTFDAAPNSTSAVVATNYAISGLTISGASLTGNVVTLTTSAQTATSLTVTVSNVTRASDGEPLATNTANFTGIAPFDISSAAAPTLTKVTVTYDATPDSASALTATNYSIPGLVVNAVSLSGSVATLTTTTQTTTTYTLTVFNVTRASDGQPLTNNTATFSQTVPGVPTVTNVVVASTSPNNGTTPYNTGTSTLTITGTGFSSITTCASAVKLDDLDGAGNAVGTSPTSCTVDSGTQITAIFPSGIRTNGSTGWNVKVTNTTGTNTTSSVTFVPVAGLVISEVYTGTSGNTTHEYLSIYNPTTASIDIGTLGLVLHIRNGTPTDSVKTLTKVTTNAIASHGFMLFASSASSSGDSWYSHRDSTYSSSSGNTLVSGGGVYISLSGTAQANVIDKVGWGSQAAGGYEGTAVTPDISSNDSIQRKFTSAVPTDTDVNSSDFNAQSTTLAHKGTGDTGL
jgi:hypothetical protein